MFKKTAPDAKDESQIGATASRRNAPEPKAAGPTPAPITHDAIAGVAFQKWQKRGCPVGQDQRDWFEAEAELKSRQPAARRT